MYWTNLLRRVKTLICSEYIFSTNNTLSCLQSSVKSCNFLFLEHASIYLETYHQFVFRHFNHITLLFRITEALLY